MNGDTTQFGARIDRGEETVGGGPWLHTAVLPTADTA
jgi:hypothetical protein